MDAELQANAKAFRDALAAKIADNINSVLDKSSNHIDQAYGRLSTLQAWKSFVFDSALPKDCLDFYIEAQNDGLTSLVLVSSGLWRQSLKSLRSLIENILHCLYYKDHPIEYRLWKVGKNRISFQKLFDFFENHPDISLLNASINPIADLKKSYSYLSDAVHSSVSSLRMTDGMREAVLWKITPSSTGQWNTIQKAVLRDINLLLVAVFADKLRGAANKPLRSTLPLAIPTNKDGKIHEQLGVRLLR